MKLIVGLGNKGDEYELTRHNVGFQVVDALVEKYKLVWRPLSLFPIAIYYDWQDQAKLLKPLTMMNRSGEAFQHAVHKWKIELQDILIVCDDVNLPLGTRRLKASGSPGGHHGLASCLEALGTEEVPRLRCGVGTTLLPKDLTEFVLSEFQREERPIAQQMITRAVEACEQWCVEGIDATMNRVNAA